MPEGGGPLGSETAPCRSDASRGGHDQREARRPRGGRASWQGPGGEPLCVRGDREALPAPGVRRGPAHRAPARRGRRRGPGGVPAGLAGPRELRPRAALRPLDLPHRRQPGGQPRAVARGRARRACPRATPTQDARRQDPSRACSTRRRERALDRRTGRAARRAAGGLDPAGDGGACPTRRSPRPSTCPMGTVMSRLARAREKLAEALRPYLGSPAARAESERA